MGAFGGASRGRLERARLWAVGVSLAALVGGLVVAPSALGASATIIPATGGGAISADTAKTPPGTGAWTTLVGPAIVEASAGELVNGGTIVLNVPSGFEFNIAASVTVTVGGSTCNGLTFGSVATTANTITVTVTAQSSSPCQATFGGIQVRPTLGTPLASGNITNTGTTGPSGNYGTLTEVPGHPVLSFTTQPSSTATGGTPFAQQPVVHSQDQFGNVRSGDSVTLAIKAGTGTAGASLTCTQNPTSTVSSGDATFSGCKIDKAGTGYVLRATVGSSFVDSTPINVSVGPPAKLGFVVYPTNPSTTALGSVVVAVQDAGGNTITTDTRAISLTINKNASTFSCGATGLTRNAGTAGPGLAGFGPCTQTTLATGYQLTADDGAGGLPAVTGSAFDVTSGPAAKLAFCWGTSSTCSTTPPSGATGGTAFSVQPSIRVQDAAGNTVTADNATVVTLSIRPGTGAAGATLTCTGGLSKTVVAGVATFSGCAIDKASPPNNPYQLVASASGLTPATSNAFAVSVGPAVKLGFVSQPSGAIVNQPFPVQPVVAVQDAGGNTVTTGSASSAVVTLGLASNPGGATLTCSSGTTVAAVAGLAAFSGCRLDRAGSGYVLQATASGLLGATSQPFTVGLPPAQISLTSTASVIVWGSGVTLSVTFGANGANKTFTLEGARDGVTWSPIATLTTDAAGRASLAYRPRTNLFYRAVFAGSSDLAAGTSNTVRVVVRQKILLRPTTSGVFVVPLGSTSQMYGLVRPIGAPLPPAKVTFEFWKLMGGAWVRVTTREAYVDSGGYARLGFRWLSRGEWRVRAWANPTPYNANSIPSPFERYSVR